MTNKIKNQRRNCVEIITGWGLRYTGSPEPVSSDNDCVICR